MRSLVFLGPVCLVLLEQNAKVAEAVLVQTAKVLSFITDQYATCTDVSFDLLADLRQRILHHRQRLVYLFLQPMESNNFILCLADRLALRFMKQILLGLVMHLQDQ